MSAWKKLLGVGAVVAVKGGTWRSSGRAGRTRRTFEWRMLLERRTTGSACLQAGPRRFRREAYKTKYLKSTHEEKTKRSSTKFECTLREHYGFKFKSKCKGLAENSDHYMVALAQQHSLQERESVNGSCGEERRQQLRGGSARQVEGSKGGPPIDAPSTIARRTGDQELEQDWVERAVEMDQSLRKNTREIYMKS